MRRLALLLLVLTGVANARAQIHAVELGAHPYEPLRMERVVPGVVEAGARRPDRIVYGYLPYWVQDSAVVRWDAITHLAYFCVGIDATGHVTPSTHARLAKPRYLQLRADAKANGVKFVLTVTNFDQAEITTLVGAKRDTTIQSIIDEVKGGGAEGVNVDFELPAASARANFALFMKTLTQRMHAEIPGSHVTYAGPVIDWSNAFDAASLLTNTDGAMMMAYGCHWGKSTQAGPVSPRDSSTLWGRCSVKDGIDSMVRAAGEGARSKIIAGVPFYGFEWPTASDAVKAATRGTGVSRYWSACARRFQTTRAWDQDSSSPFAAFTSASVHYQLWCEDAESFDEKLGLVVEEGTGIGIWALGYEGADEKPWQKVRARLFPPESTDGGTPIFDGGGLDAGSTLIDGGFVDGGTPAVDGGDAADAGAVVPNEAPVAIVAPPVDSLVGEKVTLDATGSYDPEGGDLRYRWTQVGGAKVTLVLDGAFASFTPSESWAYKFELVVTDGQKDSEPEVVIVSVVQGGGGGDAGCGCGGPGMSVLSIVAVVLRPRGRRIR